MNATTNPAFPASLTATLDRLSPLLLSPADHSSSEPFSVSCAGEILLIPYRIYHRAPSASEFHALPASEQLIVACWFTRHHDGHVRERFLRTLTTFHPGWVAAYVVALCGEYVFELLHHIWERRTCFERFALGQWLRENAAFYARTRRRIVSYWDCYQRVSFPRFGDYVGCHLLTFFDSCIDASATGGA